MRYILSVVALLEACDVTNNGRHLGRHIGFYQELEIRLKQKTSVNWKYAFTGFSPRILTSFEVWIPLRRCSMLTPGLENQYPPLHTSEANIKKNKLNHNTVKRSQQRNNQPVIRAAFGRLE
ncbi:unnamed protein product [Porites lobata]|uniref:Secreted protein n=1 Tax=Porites lobata TaxID=104759 RepID=A0ABN8N9Z9_9CNID|nr:unnamed protein product [Porites lobata]